MNENLKTGLFAAAALLVAAVAWLAGPSRPEATTPERRARASPCSPVWTTPGGDAAGDHAVRRRQPQVPALRGGPGEADRLGSIPSHSDYPADAKEHLAEAATSLMGLNILGVAPGLGDEADELDQNTIRKLHNQYGVVDPDPETVKTTDDGVGMRVTMKDKEGKTLASLIIGKRCGDQSNLHYVRYTGKDPVYIVEVDTGKLSTKFEDWIEKNLLKLNTMDLKQVADPGLLDRPDRRAGRP